ncbi:MAG TPA: sporulation transcription factor Spo0A [Limnochordia bacterium]
MPATVFIIDDNEEYCALLGGALAEEPDLRYLGAAHDGLTGWDTIVRKRPDLVILDIALPGLDGLAILSRLHQLSPRPRAVVVSACAQDPLIAQASALGADYYIVKPCELSLLVQRVHQTLAPARRAVERQRFGYLRRQVEAEVTAELTALGVPPHFKGYAYLREAITLAVLRPAFLGEVTRGLYPAVGRKHHAAPATVERSIRHAIEATWDRGDLKAIHRIFAYGVDREKGRPTNSAFIARLADRVTLRLKERTPGSTGNGIA